MLERLKGRSVSRLAGLALASTGLVALSGGAQAAVPSGSIFSYSQTTNISFSNNQSCTPQSMTGLVSTNCTNSFSYSFSQSTIWSLYQFGAFGTRSTGSSQQFTGLWQWVTGPGGLISYNSQTSQQYTFWDILTPANSQNNSSGSTANLASFFGRAGQYAPLDNFSGQLNGLLSSAYPKTLS